MYTVIETPHFSKLAADYWDEDERDEFAAWISLTNPKAGNVVSGSGGVRKVRWSRQGAGKRGGVRVISQSVGGRPYLAADSLRQRRAEECSVSCAPDS